MTKAELDAYLAAKEQEHGLSAGELRALWSQESGGSLDTGLKGQELSKGRGAAVGPFQVVPYYHPEFPAGGNLQQQADYAARFYAQGGDTQEKRLKRYYGTGTPPAGHPTTAQYVSQTMSRMPQQEQDMDTSEIFQIQGEQPQSSFTPNYIPIPQPRSAGDFPEMQQRPAGKMETWLGDPLTQMGMGMLMASGTDWGIPLGYGMANAAAGLNAQRQMENELYELQMKREESKRKAMQGDRKESMEALEWNQKQSELANVMALADEYESKGDRMTAMKLRAGIRNALKTPEYGTTPHYERTPEGKVKIVRYGSDGTRIEEEAKGVPFAVEKNLPGFQASVAEAKEGGGAIGKANAEADINAPKLLSKADMAIRVLDEAMFHPGMDAAVGLTSYVPSVRGSKAYDYEQRLKQIEGQNFLQAFESLKGGGAITEIEGQKATQAISSLNIGQSKAEHMKALQDLREIALAAKIRAESGVRVKNPYTGNFGEAKPNTGWRQPASGDGWGIRRKD